MFGILVENLVKIGEKTNLILRFKEMLFNNFNHSRKAESKFKMYSESA